MTTPWRFVPPLARLPPRPQPRNQVALLKEGSKPLARNSMVIDQECFNAFYLHGHRFPLFSGQCYRFDHRQTTPHPCANRWWLTKAVALQGGMYCPLEPRQQGLNVSHQQVFRDVLTNGLLAGDQGIGESFPHTRGDLVADVQ